MSCAKHTPTLYCHPFGDFFHVVEKCSICGARTRAGWVPHTEVKRPETLPVDPFVDGQDPRQRSLF